MPTPLRTPPPGFDFYNATAEDLLRFGWKKEHDVFLCPNAHLVHLPTGLLLKNGFMNAWCKVGKKATACLDDGFFTYGICPGQTVGPLPHGNYNVININTAGGLTWTWA